MRGQFPRAREVKDALVWYGMVWYLAMFAVGCVDVIPPPGTAMSGLDAGSTGATEAIGEEVPTPDAGMADGSGEALATRAAPLVWEPGESWEPFLNFRNDSNVNHARHSHYGRAVARILPSGCSAFLISRDRLVTAHHCTHGAPAVAATFMRHELPDTWAEIEVDELLHQLGFSDVSLRAAATTLVLEPWVCTWHSREPERDIEYYTCWAVPVQTLPGYFTSIHPGDVFGHLDITTQHPANQASTNNLTVNSPGSDSNPSETLLSPGGHRDVSVYDGCVDEGADDDYQECRGTQRDDTLPGSSGGASLRGSDNRVWGVHNGQKRNTVSDPGRNLMRHSGPFSDINRNLWAPFTANTTALQYYERFSDVSEPVATYGTAPIGGTGGTIQGSMCQDDEVVIGIVGSRYFDTWNVPSSPPSVLGNFGIVCAPVIDSAGHFLQSDHATVFTTGSHDTGFFASLGASPLTYNRYRHTAVSQGQPALPNQEIETFLCPAGYAVSGISATEKFGMVRAVRQVRCRHVFETARPTITYNLTHFGNVESGSLLKSSNCPTPSRFAVGVSVRSGWFTDRISLVCS